MEQQKTIDITPTPAGVRAIKSIFVQTIRDSEKKIELAEELQEYFDEDGLTAILDHSDQRKYHDTLERALQIGLEGVIKEEEARIIAMHDGIDATGL